uniref:hypothetical protein n=1 Tax=Nonomuraea antri TaxID=2730852 RepID=UPI001C2C10D4|nr:hypothetical protein [Nonomuraea antri]
MRLLRLSCRNRTPRPVEHLLKPIRLLIESVNDTLESRLDLEVQGGRPYSHRRRRPDHPAHPGSDRDIWHNRDTGWPVTRSLVANDH